MFQPNWTETAAATYEQLRSEAQRIKSKRAKKGNRKSSGAEGLFKQVAKTIYLLCQNPKHPGLRTHEYASIAHPYDPKQKVFEAYAQNATPGAYRVFWCYGPGKGDTTIIAITTHP